MTKSSISPYERRDQQPDYLEEMSRREKLRRIVGILILIVLTLGVIFLLWDLFTFPSVQAAPVVDDQYICTHLEEYSIDGQEAEIIRYCAKHL